MLCLSTSKLLFLSRFHPKLKRSEKIVACEVRDVERAFSQRCSLDANIDVCKPKCPARDITQIRAVQKSVACEVRDFERAFCQRCAVDLEERR